jgi:hypothetical protein
MKNTNYLDIYDAVLHDAALAKAENTPSTPAQKRIAMRVKARVQDDLADLRRAHLPKADPPRHTKPISSWLFGLDRGGLFATIDELTSRVGGDVQYAHRDLSGLSDDDLRRLIELIMSGARQPE